MLYLFTSLRRVEDDYDGNCIVVVELQMWQQYKQQQQKKKQKQLQQFIRKVFQKQQQQQYRSKRSSSTRSSSRRRNSCCSSRSRSSSIVVVEVEVTEMLCQCCRDVDCHCCCSSRSSSRMFIFISCILLYSFFYRVSLFCTMSYLFSNYPISYPPLSYIIMSIFSHYLVINQRRLAEMMMIMMMISV